METVVANHRVLMPRETILLAPGSMARAAEDYPTFEDESSFRTYFWREGFVVVRDSISTDFCEQARHAFITEVLPDRNVRFMRHEFGTYDPHTITEFGFMKYPIMNIQDISSRKYPQFRNAALQLATHDSIKRTARVLLKDLGQIIHTMYFDGNQTTWPHRDGHYIDSVPSGQMIGIWIAIEDIHPDAGRFYVIPGSHRVKVSGEDGDPNGKAYKQGMAEFVRSGPLECVSPILKQGDFLIWTCRTIHGSLPTLDGRFSRRSITAHYIPESCHFRWNTEEARRSKSTMVNGVKVAMHGNGQDPLNRARRFVKDRFPKLYEAVRSIKPI